MVTKHNHAQHIYNPCGKIYINPAFIRILTTCDFYKANIASETVLKFNRLEQINPF